MTAGERTVVMEFADRAAVHAWYDSPGYVEARKFRLAGTDGIGIIVDGLSARTTTHTISRHVCRRWVELGKTAATAVHRRAGSTTRGQWSDAAVEWDGRVVPVRRDADGRTWPGAGVAIYDPSTAPGGRVTFKGILEHIEGRMHLARVFRQRLVRVPFDLDHPYWIEDPDFDLEFHVRHIALPAPGDWRQLCIQVARLVSRPLDLERPLWEMYVIEGLDNVAGVARGSFALVTKVHHAAIDGMSGMEMTTAIHDETPVSESPSVDDGWRPGTVPSNAELLWRAGMNNARRPMHAGRVMSRAVPQLGRLQRQVQRRTITPPPTTIPRTRWSGPVSAHRVFDGVKFPLDDLRAMKERVPGATINDVVLTVVGGALRTYLLSKGELPTDPLIAMAPISVRSEAERGAAGNMVSGMFTTLGTDVADPQRRPRGGARGHAQVQGVHQRARGAHPAGHGRPGAGQPRRPRRAHVGRACRWPTGCARCSTPRSPTCPGRATRSTWPARNWSACTPRG